MSPRWAGRAAALATVLLTLALYPALLRFDQIPYSHDGFVSDLFSGELPWLVALGRQLRAGHWPVWEPGLSLGTPVMLPSWLALAVFALVPGPAAALDLYLLLMLSGASLSAWVAARRLGASCLGAMLAGVAWAHGGVLSAQWRHPIELNVLVWLPLGLAWVEPLTRPALGRVSALVGWARFAALVGWVWGAGFPQIAYASTAWWGLWWLLRVPWRALSWRDRGARVGGMLGSLALGLVAAAASLWPMRALSQLSARGQGLTFEQASQLSLWPRALLSLFWPYLFGDGRDGSYQGNDVFWESYLYCGALTAALALFALGACRRDPRVRRLVGLALVALLVALGHHTPVFGFVWRHVPGMSGFRLPQRYLCIVVCTWVLLAARGLTLVERWLSLKYDANGRTKVARVLALVPLAVALDLGLAQRRQNPLVPAATWLAPPASARTLRGEADLGRLYSIESPMQHMAVFQMHHGWSDLAAHHALREVIGPNQNLLWGLDSVDGYTGLALRRYSFIWGIFGWRPNGVARQLVRLEGQRLLTAPHVVDFLRAYGVTHVISPFEVRARGFERVASASPRVVARVREPVPRVHFVGRGWPSRLRTQEAIQHMISGQFDPRAEALLEVDAVPAEVAGAPARVAWRRRGPDEMAAEVDTDHPGWLVFSEAAHPEWEATVDGARAPIVVANLMCQAVALGPGRHRVVWRFRGTAGREGLAASALAWACVVGVWCAGAYKKRRLLRTL